jgi:outer membrane protein
MPPPRWSTASRQFYAFGYNQSWITGTYAPPSRSGETRSLLNSGTPLFNPSLSGYLDFYVTQPLLQGLSVGVNNRYIKVAKNNLKVSDLLVKQQVATTVAAVLDLYWDLVSFNEAVRIKEQALDAAQKLYEGNRKQVEIGALAGIEVTRAAAAVSAGKEALLIAETNVAQQEIVLKNALNRNAMENAWLDDVHVIPLDHIEVPSAGELRPVQDLVQEALEKRDEIEQATINLDSKKVLLKGTRNNLLPSLQAFRGAHQQRLERPGQSHLRAIAAASPTPTFVGGTGNLVTPDPAAAISPTIRPASPSTFPSATARPRPITSPTNCNCARPNCRLQRAVNQVRVDVKTNLINLQQARARATTPRWPPACWPSRAWTPSRSASNTAWAAWRW